MACDVFFWNRNSKSSVLLNNNIGTKFNITVGVRQGCLLSLVLFNIFLEKIMLYSVTNQPSSISIGGRQFNNLRFADDIDLIGGSESELETITDALEKTSTAYGMEIIMINAKFLSMETVQHQLFICTINRLKMWNILNTSEQCLRIPATQKLKYV